MVENCKLKILKPMCFEDIKKSFNTLPPATTFWLGFVGAILVICTLCFFILLGLIIKGNINLSAGDQSALAQEPTTEELANEPAADNNELIEPVSGPIVAVSSRDHVRGNPNALVTMIEYSDFECPFCKRFHETMKQVLVAYPDKVKWIYRHYPLAFHANAQKEAEATECAYELGGHEKFWQYADKIYERTASNGTGFALAELPKLAKELGLDQKSFENCLNSGKYKDYVNQAMAGGQGAGIQGTPGIILITAKGEKQLIKGALPLEDMKKIIEEAL